MKKQLILIAFAFLLVMPLVQSAPPILQTIQSGSLEILAPTYEYVFPNTDKDIYWHVLNTTQLLTNSTTNCSYHLYSQNSKGEHIVTVSPVKMFSNMRDFEVEVLGGNFSELGRYCQLIECNTVNQAGGIERCFEVTTNATDGTFDYLPLIIIFAIIISVLLFIASKLGDSHSVVSTILMIIPLFFLVGLAQIGKAYVTNSTIASIITPIQIILPWIAFGFMTYICISLVLTVIKKVASGKEKARNGDDDEE